MSSVCLSCRENANATYLRSGGLSSVQSPVWFKSCTKHWQRWWASTAGPDYSHDCATVVKVILSGVDGAPQRSASAVTAGSESSLWSGRDDLIKSLNVSLFLASTANSEATTKPKENTPRSFIIYYCISQSRGNPCLQSSRVTVFFPLLGSRWTPQTATGWRRASWCWAPGLGTGSFGALSDEAWVRSVFRPRWQRSQARRGDAHRWVTEGAAKISFTRVWLQFGIQDVSKLEDVHHSKQSRLSKCLIRTQPIFRTCLRLSFKLLHTDMETRSKSWLTAIKGGLNFGVHSDVNV